MEITERIQEPDSNAARMHVLRLWISDRRKESRYVDWNVHSSLLGWNHSLILLIWAKKLSNTRASPRNSSVSVIRRAFSHEIKLLQNKFENISHKDVLCFGGDKQIHGVLSSISWIEYKKTRRQGSYLSNCSLIQNSEQVHASAETLIWTDDARMAWLWYLLACLHYSEGYFKQSILAVWIKCRLRRKTRVSSQLSEISIDLADSESQSTCDMLKLRVACCKEDIYQCLLANFLTASTIQVDLNLQSFLLLNSRTLFHLLGKSRGTFWLERILKWSSVSPHIFGCFNEWHVSFSRLEFLGLRWFNGGHKPWGEKW